MKTYGNLDLRNCDCMELDPDYYAAMMDRIDKETRQQELF